MQMTTVFVYRRGVAPNQKEMREFEKRFIKTHFVAFVCTGKHYQVVVERRHPK